MALVGAARLACGAAAGAITKTVIAPLERIKIIHQTQGMHSHTAAGAAASKAYSGIFQSLQTILQREGAKSLWNGNGANVLRVIPNYGLRFSFNDRAREFVASFKSPSAQRGVDAAVAAVPQLSKFDLFLAGSIAGTGQITITYPAEVVFTRLTISGSSVSATRYSGIVDCITQTLRQEGPRAFYNGYSATLISGVPYVALQMSCYEIFQRALTGLVAGPRAVKPAAFASEAAEAAEATALPTATPAPAAPAVAPSGPAARSVALKLAAGAAAGLVAQTLTFPGDVLRKRMQSDGMGGRPKVYTGLWHACKTIAQREGPRAFFDGVKVNSWRCLPEGAIMFVAFDGLKQALRIDRFDAH
jgi:hypothetical protein